MLAKDFTSIFIYRTVQTCGGDGSEQRSVKKKKENQKSTTSASFTLDFVNKEENNKQHTTLLPIGRDVSLVFVLDHIL